MSKKEKNAFVRAILDEPDEDAHRLVYADWLAERGDEERADEERAEFIRAQCELARLERFEPRYEELDKRCRALYVAHKDRWWKRFAKDFGFPPDYNHLRRGFVYALWMEVKDFLKAGPELCERYPFQYLGVLPPTRIRAVEMEEDDFRSLAQSPLLCRLRALNLSWRLSYISSALAGNLLAVLAASPHLRMLRELDLIGFIERCHAGAARIIATSMTFGVLEELNLASNEIGTEGAATIVGSPVLRKNLKVLSFQENRLGDEAIREMAAHWTLERLVELDLSFNEIGPSGAAALAEHSCFQGIERLHLRGCPVDTGIVAIAESWARLRVLTTYRHHLPLRTLRSLNKLFRQHGDSDIWLRVQGH